MFLFATQRDEAGCAGADAHSQLTQNAERFVPSLLGHTLLGQMAASPTLADEPMALAAIFDRARSFAFERRC